MKGNYLGARSVRLQAYMGHHTYRPGRSTESVQIVFRAWRFCKAIILEPDRQGLRHISGSIHTDQGALRARSKNFSGLKSLEGNYTGARSVRFKAHMGQYAYRSGCPTHSVKNFIGCEIFEEQVSWSAIGKAASPYGAICIPIRVLCDFSLKVLRA